MQGLLIMHKLSNNWFPVTPLGVRVVDMLLSTSRNQVFLNSL